MISAVVYLGSRGKGGKGGKGARGRGGGKGQGGKGGARGQGGQGGEPSHSCRYVVAERKNTGNKSKWSKGRLPKYVTG